MPGEPLRVGPFIGGLNTTSDPTAIADAELVECRNFESDLDGSLISRTPIQEELGRSSWTERIICIGEAVFSNVNYLIGSNSNGVFYSQDGTGAWTSITTTIQSYVALQYANFLYIVAEPGSANPGGKWTPGGGFVAVAAIPKGMAAVIHKERLFIAPGINATTDESRIKFSDPGDFDIWNAASFIDVGQGDGTKLLDLSIFQDNLFLFKNNSTYALAFDVDPKDAVVKKISDTLGVDRQFCVINYENQVYTFHGGWVYEIVSYDFNRLNTKVPFIRDGTTPSAFADECVFISLLGDRIICRYFNKIYVYGLRTRTWSEWGSEYNRLHYFGPIKTIHKTTGNLYFAGMCVTSFYNTVQFFDRHTSTNQERTDVPLRNTVCNFDTALSNSWAPATTGEVWTVSQGSSIDFDQVSGKGIVSVGALGVFYSSSLGISVLDPDVCVDIIHPVVPAGASFVYSVRVRFASVNQFYRARVELNTAGNALLSIERTVAGVGTSIASGFSITGVIAGESLSIRIQASGSTIRAKLWRTLSGEPGNWNLSVTDVGITTAGSINLASFATAGTTNPLPILSSFDNLLVGNAGDTVRRIIAHILTKNFDMSISHQFKRLWWWGADVSTSRDVVGTATPIIVNFSVTWGQLEAYTWGDLEPNTWGQPLTSPTSVEETIEIGTGISRRFLKFPRGLRYRQINFSVELQTEGSTSDGPARIFSLVLLTQTKQTVVKSVS